MYIVLNARRLYCLLIHESKRLTVFTTKNVCDDRVIICDAAVATQQLFGTSGLGRWLSWYASDSTVTLYSILKLIPQTVPCCLTDNT